MNIIFNSNMAMSECVIIAKKHYERMAKFKGSFSMEYGIGKNIKSINASQFKIGV